ncbi:hypothetical protein SAMN05216553_12118 [Lentzea fradiae]|jgi:hypothetical protein|uniref:DUF5753 domain-containing protein n=1 Tax=Lentzea fradiae TaxID=200378 RepID=A0A1G8C588_9PSEU|nr:hypothetical protein [Lentzea fradiae]SDH40585.1 hypothetical protein SAMN05216553_12118 [Lentzea fradiae]
MQTGTDVPPQREIIGCTDALGRRRAFEVYLNEKGRICFRTPPGESAQLDAFQLDELISHLTELRRYMQ